MASRLTLHEELVLILGSRNVYYQPPESIKIKYPAIIYSRADIDNRFADNEVYNQSHLYKITIVDQDPDSEIVDKMSKFKRSKFERHYATNGLNYDVFTIVY